MTCFSSELARFVFLRFLGLEGSNMSKSLLKPLSDIEGR